MDVKLTLKLKKTTIEKGKALAKKRKTSLSQMVQNYLEKIADQPADLTISPLVKSISGVSKNPAKEQRTDYAKYLKKKYS